MSQLALPYLGDTFPEPADLQPYEAWHPWVEIIGPARVEATSVPVRMVGASRGQPGRCLCTDELIRRWSDAVGAGREFW